MVVTNRSISQELRRRGCTVDNLYLEAYPSYVRQRWLNYPLFGLATTRLIRRLEKYGGAYDIIEISGGDAYIAPLVRFDRHGRRRLIVAKCHGLEHRYWEAFQREIAAGFERATLRHRLYFGKLRLRQVAVAIRRSDLFNCLTHRDADYVVQRGWKSPEELSILPNGIEGEWYETTITRQCAQRRILWCGTWNWVKGVRTLVEVFERLVRVEPALRLTVVGSGVDRETVLSAFRDDVRGQVSVKPNVPHRDVLVELERQDVLLATSRFEGFGMIVTEAMAAGLPVVASAVGGTRDYVKHGYSGYVVEPGDVDGFVASCLSVLRSDPAKLHALRQAARRAVSALAWPCIAERTLTAYEAALSRVRE